MKKTRLLAVVLVALALLLPCAAASAATGSADVSRAQTVYCVGDELNLDGVRVVYDGETVSTASLRVTGFDSAEAGEKTVALTYRDFIFRYQVTVYPAAERVRIISVKHRVSYFVGEQLSVSDLKVRVDFLDGSGMSMPVTANMVTGFDSSEPADRQTLTIHFASHTVDFSVRIKEITYDEDSKAQADNTVVEEKWEQMNGDVRRQSGWVLGVGIAAIVVLAGAAALFALKCFGGKKR